MAASDENPLPGSPARPSARRCGRRPRRYPDRDAVVFPALGLRWSWRELDRRVDRGRLGA